MVDMGCRQEDIAKYFGVSQPTISGRIKQLKKEGKI